MFHDTVYGEHVEPEQESLEKYLRKKLLPYQLSILDKTAFTDSDIDVTSGQFGDMLCQSTIQSLHEMDGVRITYITYGDGYGNPVSEPDDSMNLRVGLLDVRDEE